MSWPRGFFMTLGTLFWAEFNSWLSVPWALRRTRFENFSHRFKIDSAWSTTSTFKPKNEHFSVEKFGLGGWGTSRNREGEEGLVKQRYSVGQFDSILWSSHNFYIVKCDTNGLGDCLHYNVSNSRQVQFELCYAFETRSIYCSFKSGEVLKTRCWKLVGPCYLHGRIAQIIHLPGVRWRVLFFQAGDILERICDEGGRRLSGTKF